MPTIVSHLFSDIAIIQRFRSRIALHPRFLPLALFSPHTNKPTQIKSQPRNPLFAALNVNPAVPPNPRTALSPWALDVGCRECELPTRVEYEPVSPAFCRHTKTSLYIVIVLAGPISDFVSFQEDRERGNTQYITAD